MPKRRTKNATTNTRNTNTRNTTARNKTARNTTAKNTAAKNKTAKNKITAAEAVKRYAARRSDIARLLDVLQLELDRHAEETKESPRMIWGRVADLDLVRTNLIDIVSFISGPKMEREDVERFLEDAACAEPNAA